MYPSIDELKKLRKGLRKRKKPHVFDEMWCSQPGIGGVMFRQDGDNFMVEWVLVIDGEKTPSQFAKFDELCIDPSKELLRLQVGWVIAEIQTYQAQKFIYSLSGPNEETRLAKVQMKLADEWRHWALVPAGHILGLV